MKRKKTKRTDESPKEAATPPCERCGSQDVVPIAYGFPGHEMWAEAERGDIKLGGCCVGSESKRWHCTACGADFGQLLDLNASAAGAVAWMLE